MTERAAAQARPPLQPLSTAPYSRHPIMRGYRRKRLAVIAAAGGLCLPLLLSLTGGGLVEAQATPTSALLNDPSSATDTPSSASSESEALPSATNVVPLPLSGQQVPYLLSTPQLSDTRHAQRGLYFTSCSNANSAGHVAGPSRLNISTIYTQFDSYGADSAMGDGSPYSAGTLRIVGIGSIANESYAFNSVTDSTGATKGLLSAIQVATRFATFPVFSNYTFLCNRLYPTQNDSQHPNVNPPSCQYGPGEVSFGVDVPFNSTYEGGTLLTTVRLTDSSSPARTIACVEVLASPYHPHRWYWRILLWLPVALAIGFFAIALCASLVTAETSQRSAYKNRAREGGAPKFVRDKLSPMVVSALSGRGLVMSPALLRFVTPGCWDIIFHLQFIVAIAMCHVQWPDFAYPFLRQAAWSSLLANITLTQPAEGRYDPLSTNATLPQGSTGSAMSDATSPLYMNASQPNTLLNLGSSQDGIKTYASMIGLQPQNLFGTCLSVWLIIIAALVILSLFVWLVDLFVQAHERAQDRKEAGAIRLPSSPGLGLVDIGEGKAGDDKNHSRVTSTSTVPGASIRRNARPRVIGRTGLHGKALHGTLVRALVLFHLPITIMSTYQLSQPGEHSTVSIALAALAFAVLSTLVPIYVIVRIARTPLQKLFEHVGTLLALGPVYHNYSPGSQLFYAVSFAHSFILGLVVGAGQRSGTAQALIIVVIEVLAALASSLWLPWGEGAMMGPLSFMANVLRIVSAVLVLLLTGLVGLSFSARSWVAYVLLLLQGIYLLGAVCVLLVKIVEALIRLCWRVRFDERTSGRTAGLGGAIRKIKRRKMKGHAKASSSVQLQNIKMEHRMSSGSTNTLAHMLPKAQHVLLHDARRTSYLGNGMGTPASAQMKPLRLDEENSHIMAALPPVSPGQTRYDGQGGADSAFVRTGGGRATDVNPYSTLSGTSAPQRPQLQRPRPMSQSGVVGTWPAEEGVGVASNRATDRTNSYHALARTPSHELSSTQAAAPGR